MKHSLTKLQGQVLEYIGTHLEDAGGSPSQQEIADAMSFKSKSQVNRLLKQLEDRGYISRLPGRRRSIVLMPDDGYETSILKRIRDAAGAFVTIQEVFRRDYDQDQRSKETKDGAPRVERAFSNLKDALRGEA